MNALIGDIQTVAASARCPIYPQHRLVNTGRDEALFGDLWVCACGRRDLSSTDEFRARIAVARDGRGEG